MNKLQLSTIQVTRIPNNDWREIFYNHAKVSKDSLDSRSANHSERNGTPVGSLRNKESARNKVNLLKKTYGREVNNDQKRREENDCSKYLLNNVDFEGSEIVSSFDHNQQDSKLSETKDSGGIIITSEKEILQSNKTTICSNPDDLTREKRFTNEVKEKKKYVLKSNNGKFMLSKKILNINKDKTVEIKQITNKQMKKLNTQKDICLANLSIENSKLDVIPSDMSYVGKEQEQKKDAMKCMNMTENNYFTEYTKGFNNTYKIGTHQNSLEGTFKFEREKRYSQNSGCDSKERFKDTTSSGLNQSKININCSMNCSDKDDYLHNTTNSARQKRDSNDHNNSMGFQLK